MRLKTEKKRVSLEDGGNMEDMSLMVSPSLPVSRRQLDPISRGDRHQSVTQKII